MGIICGQADFAINICFDSNHLSPGREFLRPQNQVYVSLNESEIRIKQLQVDV